MRKVIAFFPGGVLAAYAFDFTQWEWWVMLACFFICFHMGEAEGRRVRE